ncbi:MAG: glutaredoxin domain-containing protein [Ornithinimicrobium sp.]
MTSTPKTPSSDVVIYWRPGCGFCARLRSTLGPAAEHATWINIWEDTEAAAFVRSANNGNETVPTVVLDGIPVTNPDPTLVKEKLAA